MIKYKKQKANVTYTSGRKETFFPKSRDEERDLKRRFAKLETVKSVEWSDR